MKRRFLTILTASVLLLGVAGFANSNAETASVQIQKTELPTTVY
jgi:peptidoglycan hydrolase CwlO-like protein